MENGTDAKSKKPSRKKRKKPGVMNIVLVIVGIALAVFTVEMIRLFTIYGTIPDTLVTCVFAACGGEFGIMGWIKTTKERNQNRRWELNDRREAQRIAEEQAQEPPEETTDGSTEERNEL